MLALFKKINELGSIETTEALLSTTSIEYLIGAEWVTYAGGRMCCKVGQGPAKYDMDFARITAVRTAPDHRMPETVPPEPVGVGASATGGSVKQSKKGWFRGD